MYNIFSNILNKTLWPILRGNWCFTIWKFSSFGKTFYFLFTLFTVLNLNDSYVIYKSWSTFQKKHVEQYSEGIGIFKFENFHLLVMFFSFFLPFSLFIIQIINILYIKIVNQSKETTLANTQRELVYYNLKIFIFW